MKEATARILDWISRIRPAYARMLRCAIGRMTEEGQLDRVTQALAAITPTQSKAPEGPGMSAEDGALVERFEAAVKRMESWGELPK